jgi:hypothetical protein
MTKELKSAAKSALWGVVLLVGALWFWLCEFGNPFDDFALIFRGQTTQGFIIDTWEEPQDTDKGTMWFHGGTYKYRLPDGREFTQKSKGGTGRLREEVRYLARPFPIQVEYLPDDPDVSRIKGSGSPNLFDWLWRKIGVGGLLLALFLAPGISILRSAVQDVIRYRRSANGTH